MQEGGRDADTVLLVAIAIGFLWVFLPLLLQDVPRPIRYLVSAAGVAVSLVHVLTRSVEDTVVCVLFVPAVIGAALFCWSGGSAFAFLGCIGAFAIWLVDISVAGRGQRMPHISAMGCN